MKRNTLRPSSAKYILAGSLLDGSGSPVRRNVFLQVENGIITAISPAEELHGDKEAGFVDFSHCTILPALLDCSIALTRSPSLDPDVRVSFETADTAGRKALLERHLRYCLAHGVLGVADNDDLTEQVKNGHEKTLPGCGGIDIRISGRDFLRIAYSADMSGGEDSSPLPGLEALRSILRNKKGKKAVVVANGQQQVAEALAVGCDAIEQGYGMGEENLRTMAERNVLWIPSVLRAKNGLDGASSGGDVACRFSTRYVAPGKPVPGAETFWKKMLGEHLSQLRLARTLGVSTAVGTGAGSIGILHGESVVEEMKLFIKAGWTLGETIRCASENGARFFGMKELGALSVGRHATFLVTRGTPQQLPRKLAYLESIYIDGAPSAAYRKNPIKSV